MFPETELLPPPVTEKPSEETFFIGKEEFSRWVLFGDEWIELDESMIVTGECPECKKSGHCVRGGIIVQSIKRNDISPKNFSRPRKADSQLKLF